MSGGDSLNLNLDDGIDTSLNGMHFTFLAFNEQDNPACTYHNIGFSSAYAFTKHCKVLNPILPESYIVRLDKDIRFNSDTIPAGTNLINHPAFKSHWIKNSFEWGKNNVSIEGSIVLNSTIYNQIVFDPVIYNVEFGFSTEDGQSLRKTLDVVYKL